MMKRPWQIWMLLLFSLALVLPAMVWLTMKAVELDRTEAEARRQAEAAHRLADLARQQAELQERVSSALWRMDWTLTPLVAQEAARPYFVYRPFYPAIGEAGGKTTKGRSEVRQVPSPLLIQPSEYVRLHFECRPDNSLSSPQVPTNVANQAAIENGATEDNIFLSRQRLEQLRDDIDHGRLLGMLPDRTLPPVEVKNLAPGNSLTYNYNGDNLSLENPNVMNDLGLQQLNQFEAPSQSGMQSPQPNASEPADASAQPNAPSAAARNAQSNAPQADAPPPSNRQPIANAGRQQGATPQQAAPPQGEQQSGPPGGAGPRRQAPLQRDEPLSQRQIASVDEYLENVREQMKRAGEEWQGRNRAYQSYAQSQLLQQRFNTASPPPPTTRHVVAEGVTRPVWIGSKLILARRVNIDDQTLIQGCWLDWPKMRRMLLDEVRQLVPEADLVPVTSESNVQPGRMLATLPVQLVLGQAAVAPPIDELDTAADLSGWSAIRVSLVIAWTCLGLATIAVVVLLQGVVTLSERRGAFVAAVTHELRTPLTTFRMYAEMLSAGMIPDAQQRQQYLETLRIEADRLSHLVENVLAYARLERGKPGRRREPVKLEALLDRVESRLADRAKQADMQLVVEADGAAREVVVNTDPGAVEQILFNLVDNACKYAALADDRRIHLAVEPTARAVQIRVRDHGPGISPGEVGRLFRPFSKSVHEAAATAPGVGLGLALCRRLAAALGGALVLEAGDDGASFLLTLPRGK